MSIRYLTFDCYGTLIDWKLGIENSFRDFFEFALPIDNETVFDKYVAFEMEEENTYKKYSEVLRDTSLKLAGSLGLDAQAGAGEKFAGSLKSWAAFPDTSAALKEMGRRGYKRVILSNVDRNLLEETIKNNDLEVDGFITAEDTMSYKPNNAHWLEFFRKYKAVKEETLHVANSIYHDILPASAIGIKTAWVNRYGEKPPVEAKPDYIVSDLSGLLDVLG